MAVKGYQNVLENVQKSQKKSVIFERNEDWLATLY